MTEKIGDAARRTNSLVESMLSFAQEMPVNRSNVNLRSLLESAVNLTRAERRHRVRVEIEELETVPLVEADANQLIQVFVQIIDNAIDAMEGNESGLLTIRHWLGTRPRRDPIYGHGRRAARSTPRF